MRPPVPAGQLTRVGNTFGLTSAAQNNRAVGGPAGSMSSF